jgi:PD-(D/E)XK nuclease superfamily protein
MLTTDQKGAIAEIGIAWHAFRLGVDVYKPIAEGGRCDLIFDLDEKLWRVQCKWASRHDDVLVVRCCSNRRAREGLRRRLYTADEIDAFAAYCAELDRCFFLPFARFSGRAAIQLRLAPTRNNQRLGINWADDYDFVATLGRHHGAIAQLGERQSGTLEVAGSSPAGSTLFPM